MLPDAVKTEPGPEEPETPRAPRSGLRRASAWQMPVALVIVLIALLGLCQLTGLAKRLRPLPIPTPTATLVPAATALPTLALTSTPVPTSTATPVPVIMAGGQVLVQGTGADRLRLRAGPALNQEMLGMVEDGSVLKVLEGPTPADGFQWWKVQTSDGLEGWAAGDWLIPVAP